jgi:hypothetical protein
MGLADAFGQRPRLVDSRAIVARLPPLTAVRRELPRHGIADIRGHLTAQLAGASRDFRAGPGDRVALAVGSRGIGSIAEVISTLAGWLTEAGAEPFIVPAMGSHGSATADGQAAVLASLGITEAAVGAPVRPDMAAEQIGSVPGPDGSGVPVYTASTALRADWVIPVGRVKPHTDFRGPVESGLLKMLAIGLGKLDGPRALHRVPPEHFSALLRAAGNLVLRTLPVPFGVAIVEDAYEAPAIVEVIPGERIDSREPELLAIARGLLPALPFTDIDILLVSEMGKDVSGTGMDTNVTGRFYRGPRCGLNAERVVALDLTDKTHGNATGVGMADIVTARLAAKIDWHSTYANEVTARLIEGCRLPLVAVDDEEAIAIAAETLSLRAPERVRLAWIRNTLELAEFAVTEPLWAELSEDRALRGTPGGPMRFTEGAILR